LVLAARQVEGVQERHALRAVCQAIVQDPQVRTSVHRAIKRTGVSCESLCESGWAHSDAAFSGLADCAACFRPCGALSKGDSPSEAAGAGAARRQLGPRMDVSACINCCMACRARARPVFPSPPLPSPTVVGRADLGVWSHSRHSVRVPVRLRSTQASPGGRATISDMGTPGNGSTSGNGLCVSSAAARTRSRAK
jgi:hypothetical protein